MASLPREKHAPRPVDPRDAVSDPGLDEIQADALLGLSGLERARLAALDAD